MSGAESVPSHVPRSRHPPRPPLAFRAGVTGHRRDRLHSADENRLREVIRDILVTVKKTAEGFDEERRFYSAGGPSLRAVSPLAEGSDRLFAGAALDLGFALCCPMPFAQAEFKKDFAAGKASEPDSEARFDGLLERARKETALAIFELDGSREHPDDAYAAASRVLLGQSDLLLVIWDGEENGRRGGTEDTFAEARRSGTPVAWIDARAPHTWQLVTPSAPYRPGDRDVRAVPSGGTPEALEAIVRDILDVPCPRALEGRAARRRSRRKAHSRIDPRIYRDELMEALDRFYAESRPRVTFGAPAWTFFRDIVANFKLTARSIAVIDFERTLSPEWTEKETDATSSTPRRDYAVLNAIRAQFRPYFAWPDALAVLYSQAYRGALLAAYVFSAIAVAAALLPSAAGWLREPPTGPQIGCIVGELLLIVSVLAFVSWGRHKRWHERWIDYRLAAELLRPLGVLALLGGSRPLPQLPSHLAAYGAPGMTWMAWYARAIERSVGLPTARVNGAHVRVCLEALNEILRSQLAYHDANEDQCGRMERHLHRLGLVLFVGTLLACGAHLVPVLRPSFELPRLVTSEVLSFVGGFFPALGATLAGIANQSEFARTAKRSEAMARHLEVLIEQISVVDAAVEQAVQQGRPASGPAVALIAQTAELMVNEVLDWRVVLLERPLTPPS